MATSSGTNMDELKTLLNDLKDHPNLAIKEGEDGKSQVVCQLTSHEMPCTIKAVQMYINGKKYKYACEHKLTSKEKELCSAYLVEKRRQHLHGRRFQKAINSKIRWSTLDINSSTEKDLTKQEKTEDEKDTEIWIPSDFESDSAEVGSEFEDEETKCKDEDSYSFDVLDKEETPLNREEMSNRKKGSKKKLKTLGTTGLDKTKNMQRQKVKKRAMRHQKGKRKEHGNHCRNATGRLFSVSALQRGALLTEIPSCTATNLLVRSRIFHVNHVGFRSAATVKSKEYDDSEFVIEESSFTSESEKDADDMIKNIKEKTGVIMKVTEKKDGENGTKIFIRRTQQEVCQALFYLKSSANQDSSNQRLILLQDDEIEQHHSKEKPIWAYYRRNFKGQKPPMKTRKKCIRGKGEKQIVSGNPCPICRLYLAGGYKLDYKDVDLLSQFISPHTGEVFEASKTGVCRYQQEHLLTAIQTAKDFGLLPYSVPGPRSIAKPAKRTQIPVNVRLK